MTDPVFTIETVTPMKAARWLKRNIANRRVSPKVVRNYAGDMSRGEWLLNGEAIKFDRDGNLLDGQHRLGAIVHNGKSVRLATGRFSRLVQTMPRFAPEPELGR